MLLEVNEVSKHFGGLVALDKVSFSVQEGEILGVIGPNGAGKTTLLNCIAGVYRPDHGKIKLLNEDITGIPPEIACKKGIARTFQIPQPFPRLSALENVLVSAVFGRNEAKGDSSEHAKGLLEFMEFPLSFEITANALNTAQLKRLDLARALASDPRLLLFDEPAAGLTPVELESLMSLIRKINKQGVTIILVEHLMKFVIGLCQRLIVLHFGKKIVEGETEAVANHPKVVEVYLGEEYFL